MVQNFRAAVQTWILIMIEHEQEQINQGRYSSTSDDLGKSALLPDQYQATCKKKLHSNQESDSKAHRFRERSQVPQTWEIYFEIWITYLKRTVFSTLASWQKGQLSVHIA